MEAARMLHGCMYSSCCPIDNWNQMDHGEDDTCYKMTDDYSQEKSQYTINYNVAGDLVT